jgi:hypothetical protein
MFETFFQYFGKPSGTFVEWQLQQVELREIMSSSPKGKLNGAHLTCVPNHQPIILLNQNIIISM